MKGGSRVALVTGSAMGYKDYGPSIGGAIAIRLARDGYKLVVVDMLRAAGERTVEIIKGAGGDAIFVRADVSLTKDIKMLVSFVKKNFGRLDCLVNNVARYSPGMLKSASEISEREWYKTLDVNLNSYFKMSKYFIPLLLKSGFSTIINISSIESMSALPNFSVYSVSKSAINSLTRTLAVDYAPMIRSNAVLPGFVRIANSENGRTPSQLKGWYSKISRQYPLKRVCEVEEIASVVSFLASKESSYINGQTIIVDGGKSIFDFHEF